MLEVDFRRTFGYWAKQAGVGTEHLHERWQLDEAYRQHEIGVLEFGDYIDVLSGRLEISLPLHDWEAGWNELFVGPYPQVQQRLATLNGLLPLYAFTNTNPTHEACWRQDYPQALQHFKEIYVSSTIGLRKPDLVAYEHVAVEMGFKAEEILFVDDTEENVIGATGSGMQARWVRSEADVVEVLDELIPGARDR